MPKWNTISISGYHIREAGSTAVQELAFTFADAIEYVKSAMAAGLKVDEFAPRLSFFFASHNNLLEEVAKFRAARRIWARIMKEKFQAGEKSQMMRFHTQTGGVTLTAQQPMNNVVRVTLQALAAVLGGTQSLHTNSMDEALALPTEDSVRVALRTQQIIAYESGVADTVDPLAGSYYVEALTNEIEKEVWKYLDKIEAMGGMLAAIEAGYPQKQIQDSSYAYQKEIDSGEQVIVGQSTSSRVEEDLSHLKTLKVSPEGEALQNAAPAQDQKGARQRGREESPGQGQGSRRRRRQPDAADPGSGQGLRHPAGDRRPDARRLRRVQGKDRYLIISCIAGFCELVFALRLLFYMPGQLNFF